MPRLLEGIRKLAQGRHEGFRNKDPAVRAEMSRRIGQGMAVDRLGILGHGNFKRQRRRKRGKRKICCYKELPTKHPPEEIAALFEVSGPPSGRQT